MIRLEIVAPSSGAGAAVRQDTGRYRIAGHEVVSRPPLGFLEPFRRPPGEAPVEVGEVASTPGAPERSLRPVYRGRAWIAGAMRATDCARGSADFRVEIAGLGRLRVAAGGELAALEGVPGASAEALAEAIVGPGLILALALGRVFCLHASAVRSPAGAVAFVGASGAGKSTLARLLEESSAGRVERLSDDVLPVGWGRRGPEVLVPFPQLKLAADRQPSAAGGEVLALRRLYVLSPSSSSRGGASGVEVASLSPREGALAVVRHTVASRLFDAALLEGHLDFASRIAGTLPVRRLSYPWSSRLEPALAAELGLDLEAA